MPPTNCARPSPSFVAITDVALEEPYGLEECTEALREINAETGRLSLLINNLLTLARVDEEQTAARL